MESQEKYKLSRYNVFHQDGDVQYMWNTYSNALLKLDKKSQKYIQPFYTNSLADDGSNEFSLLKNNGFIVYEKLDEFGRVRLQEKQALFSHNTREMSIVIAPGMGCNYNCSYCFESSSDKSGVMSPEIAEEVADYICRQTHSIHNLRQLDIQWFGGEPLLYFNVIEIISTKLMEHTQQNNIKYSAGIVTNGKFLDANMLPKLQKCGIEKIQVTLDGIRDIYCRSKGASSNDFDCVIENILHASDKIKLSIRLNIPDNDIKGAIAITDYLFL